MSSRFACGRAREVFSRMIFSSVRGDPWRDLRPRVPARTAAQAMHKRNAFLMSYEAIERGHTRREFGKLALATAALLTINPRAWAAEKKEGIPYRTLGRTGEKISMLGLGGYHIGTQKTDEESVEIIRTAIDRGINFLDNCWDYNGGASEIRMGKALRDGYREKAFLMSKIDGQTRKSAAEQIDESLKRLEVDRVDLMQFHEVIRMEDPERIFGEGGSAEAMLEAKKAGKVRYIGFTGHKNPDIHLHMLDVAKAHDFHFDAVQMPLNVMDMHFESFGKKVLPRLVKEEIGVLGMKPLGGGIILESGTVTPQECLHFAMNLRTSVVITGCDSLPVLEQALDAVSKFQPMNEKQTAELLAKTASVANDGKFEKYKVSPRFDGTVANPHWLG